jgi:hypothetical protein
MNEVISVDITIYFVLIILMGVGSFIALWTPQIVGESGDGQHPVFGRLRKYRNSRLLALGCIRIGRGIS